MKDRTVVRAGLASAAVVLLAVAVAAAFPAGQALVVEDAGTGDTLLRIPVEEGASVVLAYTHSVERTPVRDVYAVRDGELEMTRMAFQSYGWGLPAGADVTRENGSFVYDPPGSYAELYVHPGPIAGHALIVGDDTFDLVALSGGGTVRLSIAVRSPAATLTSHDEPR